MIPAMPVTAVLFDALLPPLLTEPLRVGGLTVLDRQARQARRAGAAVIVLGPDGILFLSPDVTSDIVVIDAGVILDERIVAAIVAALVPAVAIWPADTGAGTERIDAASSAAGIGIYPAALVRTVVANLGDWDVASTLCRTALADGASRLDLTTLTAGNEPPLTWARPDDPMSASAATAMLVAAARHVPHDAPGRWVNEPIATRVAGWLAPTHATAAAASLVVVMLAVAATASFAFGYIWAGLILALATGMLDGVDCVIARVRLDPSHLSKRTRPVVAIADYGWLAAAGIHFATAMRASGPVAVAALIIGFAAADRLQDRFFHLHTGSDLAGAGTAEWYLRLAGAERDTRLWLWLPFALTGAWYTGFAVLAVFTAATFFVAQRRVFNRLAAQRRVGETREINRCPTPGQSV